MPYFPQSAYRPHVLFRAGHFSTVYSGVLRRTSLPEYKREKLELRDGDFLLLDSIIKNLKQALVLCHGLEGHSRSNYNNSSANYFLENNFSVFAWNNRSCGGEMNRLSKLYHHGEVEDLSVVVDTILDRGFEEVYLLGFSMGGAQIMNYFGRKDIDARVKGGVAVSTPVLLKSSAARMEGGLSKVYLNRFIGRIRKKIIQKAKEFPDLLSSETIQNIKSFEDLAENFIVPIYKYKNLEDFYEKASPAYTMKNVKTPVLILNALDDPIIGEGGFPIDFASSNDYVYLETPKYGGHCGFTIPNTGYSYAEIRALEFFKDIR